MLRPPAVMLVSHPVPSLSRGRCPNRSTDVPSSQRKRWQWKHHARSEEDKAAFGFSIMSFHFDLRDAAQTA